MKEINIKVITCIFRERVNELFYVLFCTEVMESSRHFQSFRWLIKTVWNGNHFELLVNLVLNVSRFVLHIYWFSYFTFFFYFSPIPKSIGLTPQFSLLIKFSALIQGGSKMIRNIRRFNKSKMEWIMKTVVLFSKYTYDNILFYFPLKITSVWFLWLMTYQPWSVIQYQSHPSRRRVVVLFNP